MSQSGNNPYSQQGNPPAGDKLLSEVQAVWMGLALSAVAIILAITGLNQIEGVINRFLMLGFGLYLTGFCVQFWTARSYEDGFTLNELGRAVCWPAALPQNFSRDGGVAGAVSGARSMISGFQGQHIDARDDDSVTLIPSTIGGVVFGVVASFLSVLLLINGWFEAVVIIIHLVWFGVILYCVGFMVNFWSSKAYRGGMSMGDIIKALLWVVDLAIKLFGWLTRRRSNS